MRAKNSTIYIPILNWFPLMEDGKLAFNSPVLHAMKFVASGIFINAVLNELYKLARQESF